MRVSIRRQWPRRRRGSMTVFVLVCLLVIAMICGVLLRIGLTERERIRGEERKLQTEWLVESGLERAAAKLASDPKYGGETWDLAASDLNGPLPGRVTITRGDEGQGIRHAARPRSGRLPSRRDPPCPADQGGHRHAPLLAEERRRHEPSVSAGPRIYPHRTPGRCHDHRHPGFALYPGGSADQKAARTRPVPQQFQAIESRARQLCFKPPGSSPGSCQ